MIESLRMAKGYLVYLALCVPSMFAGHTQPAPCIVGPQTFSLDPTPWRLSGAFYGRTQSPRALSGGGFYFDMPLYSSGRYVGYLLVVPCGGGAGIGTSSFLSLTIRVVATGSAVFMYDSEPFNTCITPATVRPYFQAVSSDWTNPDGDGFRWWSNPIAFTLGAGDITLTIPLTSDNWSSAYGARPADNPAGWQASLARTAYLGMTFGGGCFFGHGVNVQGGTAQFQVLSYSVF